VYIDDILIASNNEEEHKENLHLVFQRLKKYSLTINLQKSIFGEKSVKFLGYNISEEGTLPDKGRVATIQNANHPKPLKNFVDSWV